METISVIVPVYNVELYLRKCIDSLLNQTYKDLEILLIDDGSKDSSGRICDEYSQKDNRIKVIHKENGGLSDARNCALDLARGEYISFVDSDDYVDTEFFNCLYNNLKEFEAEISVCEFSYEKEDGERINSPIADSSIRQYNQEDSLKVLLNQKPYSNSSSGKLFTRELFDGVRFPVGRIYEDVATIYKTFLKTSEALPVVFCAKPLYHYIKRSGSISNSDFSLKQLDSYIFAEQMVEDISNRYPSLRASGLCRLIDSYLYVIGNIDINRYHDIYCEIINRFYRIRGIVLFSKEASKRRRFFCLISYLGERLLIKSIKTIAH